MKLKKEDIEKAVVKLKLNGVMPPYKIYVQLPYENPFGMWLMGVELITGRNVKEMWRKYKKRWKEYNKSIRKAAEG